MRWWHGLYEGDVWACTCGREWIRTQWEMSMAWKSVQGEGAEERIAYKG